MQRSFRKTKFAACFMAMASGLLVSEKMLLSPRNRLQRAPVKLGVVDRDEEGGSNSSPSHEKHGRKLIQTLAGRASKVVRGLLEAGPLSKPLSEREPSQAMDVAAASFAAIYLSLLLVGSQYLVRTYKNSPAAASPPPFFSSRSVTRDVQW